MKTGIERGERERERRRTYPPELGKYGRTERGLQHREVFAQEDQRGRQRRRGIEQRLGQLSALERVAGPVPPAPRQPSALRQHAQNAGEEERAARERGPHFFRYATDEYLKVFRTASRILAFSSRDSDFARQTPVQLNAGMRQRIRRNICGIIWIISATLYFCNSAAKGGEAAACFLSLRRCSLTSMKNCASIGHSRAESEAEKKETVIDR